MPPRGYRRDAIGNRETQNKSVLGIVTSDTYVYDDANRLTSVNAVNYTWDNNGNLLNDGVNLYTYDSANRLKTMTGGVSYTYNGLGERLRETVSGNPNPTTTFTMDLNAGLTQALSDGTNTYIYGNGRIAQATGTGTEYFLGDALGSVRQLTNAGGTITYAKVYDPYGVVSSTSGSSQSAYGYTNEYTSQGLVYLRSRMYSPIAGRFTTKDTWMGDYNRPLSLNRWMYVEGNPINYIDPSGNILDPSDPTKRGTIIHKMIQAQYGALYRHIKSDYDFERIVPLGKASGLEVEFTESGVYYVKQPAGLYGRADIIDFGEGGLYEIKPISAPNAGVATAVIYIKAWNDAIEREDVRPVYLSPGLLYPQRDTIVGTDPNDPNKWVKAKLARMGVILYWDAQKTKADPIPVFVFEWNPKTQKVEKRRYALANAQVASDMLPAYQMGSGYDSFLAWLAWLTGCPEPIIINWGPGYFIPSGLGNGNGSP